MNCVRIIPRLDIKGPNLVKGIHLEGLRVLGSPDAFARYYYEQGADELLYLDVVASLYDRNSLHEFIKNTAKEIFIPLTVGGGIRTLENIREILRAGADKVALNTAAIKNPSLIKEASQEFGSSTIVVSIEAIKHDDGKYYAYYENGREFSNLEVIDWALKVQELGAGEILLTSVDREGTGLGMDIELIRSITKIASVPVIAHGGVGKNEDISNVIMNAGADAVSVASILHYNFVRKFNSFSQKSSEGNTEFVSGNNKFSLVEDSDIHSIKDHLDKCGIVCRK